jgi:hypothetical protein
VTGTDCLRLMALQLLGEAPPPPVGQPGRVIRARDEPIAPEFLVGVTSCTEVGLLLGITKQAASLRLKKANRHD